MLRRSRILHFNCGRGLSRSSVETLCTKVLCLTPNPLQCRVLLYEGGAGEKEVEAEEGDGGLLPRAFPNYKVPSRRTSSTTIETIGGVNSPG